MKNISPLLFILLIALSCSKEEIPPTQTYNILVVDSLNMPISGIEVYFNHAIGGTYPLDRGRGITDKNGTIAISTSLNPDTVQAILIRENWDETFWHQIIGIESEQYLIHSISQNGIDKTAARRKVNEGDLITIQILPRGTLRLKYKDVNSLNDISYMNFRITGLIGNVAYLYEMEQPIGLFENDQFSLYVPSTTALKIEWFLFSGVFLNGNLEKNGTNILQIETLKESALEIER